ncbi:MAG: oxidoreductase [Magnetovibrio sp.]|nr:oxidoreductase [Magnetovibrio sp.]|tara:strand:+ start:2332 stop:3354 length:1023 start_codon:yes stop_codon:yes gene_type:complete
MCLKIGIVGYGYWGPNLVRNFNKTDGCEVLAVCDRFEDRLTQANKLYPSIKTYQNYSEFLESGLDAVAVATPVASHYQLAMQALETNKHLLIEKPMAESAKQAENLILESKKRGLILMVDHTFVYTGAVQKIHDLYKKGELGDIQYFDSTRMNLGLYQHDVDVIWDLAVHDLSILDFIINESPSSVSAVGTSHVPGMPEDMAYMSVFYESGTMAHISVNWLSPVKVRRTVIGGTKKMIVWDDLEPSEKIKVYDTGVTITDDPEKIYDMIVGYRVGDMWAPQVPMLEALAIEAEHFIECIKTKSTPITSGGIGLRVVKTLEAATQSMKNRGTPIILSGEKG